MCDLGLPCGDPNCSNYNDYGTLPPPTWEEVKKVCSLCPERGENGLPYMIWWSYCQKHCNTLRSCEDVKSYT